MVVDDDATNNMICNFLIKRMDPEAEIKTFGIPEEALLYIKNEYNISGNQLPTVLFLDVNMPSISGWEFLDEFMLFDKSLRNQFSIYILSSSIEDFSEKAKTYTIIQDFLSKPLKINDLEKIREHQKLSVF